MRVAVVHRPGLRLLRDHPYDPPNPVYAAVEAAFGALGLDAGRAGSPGYNPLGDLIAPGDQVIVKPDFGWSRDRHTKLRGEQLEASSTHASLLRPVLDFALRAAGPTGRVTVVDAPGEECELDQVIGPLGVDRLIGWLARRHRGLGLRDLRRFRMVPHLPIDDVRKLGRAYHLGLLVRRRLPGDPRGYRVVDLGARSWFADPAVRCDRLGYHRSQLVAPRRHHTDRVHEYSIPQTVLDADVIINLPKMKTHRQAGVTLSLQSAVGLTDRKRWLPHFQAGDPSLGGDQRERPPSRLQRLEEHASYLPLPGGHRLVARKPRLERKPQIRDGNWESNDTLWRTVLDLNRILLCADRDGVVRDVPQRRYLSLVDGIVAGEGEGPAGATPIHAGLLVAGLDPILVDYVCAELMGFDPMAIPQIARGVAQRLLATTDLDALERVIDGPTPDHVFRPPRGWPSLLHPAKRGRSTAM